ncbi:MAG: hypothetical protein ACRDTG_15210 [Pseudonocardiaceae bacterium]
MALVGTPTLAGWVALAGWFGGVLGIGLLTAGTTTALAQCRRHTPC